MMDECRKHAHSEMIYGMSPVVLMGRGSRVGALEMDVFQRLALVGCQQLNRKHACSAPARRAPASVACRSIPGAQKAGGRLDAPLPGS